MTAVPDERATFFEALRRSSARLLKLDADCLSGSEAVRVDRCAALRLLLDRMASQQLAGGELDAKSYIAASQELERLLGGQPEAPTHVFASNEARNKLRAMIERTLGNENTAAAELADVMAREEAVQALAAAPGDAAQAAPPPPVTALPLPANVVPIDAARAAERAADERAWRDYAYNNGGGALIAPAWSPPDDRRR
jgi:hypothetical protein